MLATLLIVFREVLEAGLVISIILAACKGVTIKMQIITGILAGICGAVLLALFTNQLENMLYGIGQEVFNAVILLLAVVMLSWQVLWMSIKGKQLANESRSEAEKILARGGRYFAITVIVAIAVLREGSEIVLFLYSLSLSSGISHTSMLAGGIAGIVCGALVSWALYSGLILIPLRYIFMVSNFVLVIIAAGLASQAVGILASVDILPDLGAQVWNSAFLLSDNSWAGNLARTIFGYTATPMGIQICSWVLVFVVVYTLRFYLKRKYSVTQ
ncbi:FTR1 family protein [Klebsiella sp. 2680]|uniref:FTR1 family iron permease n=1 Tax=Klebsiella sp. 2680 TaxID=2018037 RepID=UPI00115BB6D5|nr:FTR1 family protein [Klebsiella sp. 2680]